MCFYLATFAVLLWLRIPFFQWVALTAVTTATVLTISLVDHGRWSLGLFVPAGTAVREMLHGSVIAIVVIGAADVLILLLVDVRRSFVGGFPWLELAAVYIPAVFHEELLFRGYVFQRIWRRSPAVALILVAFAFAALHLRNHNVTLVGLSNIFLGGVLLGQVYGLRQRLWMPIGVHFMWNLLSGPILGYAVSGYSSQDTILRTVVTGPVWLTGGAFGIEGSVCLTVVLLAAVAWLASNMIRARRVETAARRIP